MKTLKACGALLFISIAIAAFPNRIILSLVVCSVDIFTDIYCPGYTYKTIWLRKITISLLLFNGVRAIKKCKGIGQTIVKVTFVLTTNFWNLFFGS